MIRMLTLVQAGFSYKWGNDSQRLLLEYFDVIQNCPSQIYHSALLFSPSLSWLRKCYCAEVSQEFKVVKGLPAEWGACSRTVALDGTPLALICWKDTIAATVGSRNITILNGITGNQVATLSGHTAQVRSLVFLSDGTLLVSGSDDKTVKFWDVQTGGVVETLHGHTGWVYSISVSADRTMIASASRDKTIRLWNIQTKGCLHIIEQQQKVFHVRFSPTDSQHLISVSGDKVWRWNINGHQIGPTYDGHYVAFSLDSTQFVSCQEKAVVVQNSDTGAIVAKFHAPGLHKSRKPIRQSCFSPDGRLIAAAVENVIYVWDITGSDPHAIETFVGHTDSISCLTFSSPSSLISSAHQSIKFWQIGALPINPVVTNQEPAPLTSAPVKSITLQAKDGITISSYLDGVVRTWDIVTGLCRASFQTPAKGFEQSDVRLINGRLIFVWQVGEEMHIWDVEKEKPLQTVQTPGEAVEDIRISGGGSKVFCLSWEYIQAWSIWTGEVVSKVKLEYSVLHSSLTVDNSRIWIHIPSSEPRGWDFGILGSSPIQLSSMSSPSLSANTKLWEIGLSRVKDTASGKVVFQLAGRFADPVDSQWDGQFLVAGYESGEVLILDFNHVLPQ